jgi:hypothetical protein
MKEDKLKAIAQTFFDMGMLDRSAAHLLLDMVDGEPLALADIEAVNDKLNDVPCFFGGRGCIGPQPLTSIKFQPMRPTERHRHLAVVR